MRALIFAALVSLVLLQPQALPRYERTLLLEQEAATSANVSFGDVDGDGKLDIVLAKGRHWPLVDRVLIGDGRGGIRRAYDLGTASDRTYSGRLADLDGDGDLDVVISNDAPDPKLVYLNDGKGRFTVGSTYGRAEWETRNATVVDINGDTQPDIVVANRSAKGFPNFICLNRGSGRFDSDCTAIAPYPATTVTAADFNRDGLIDLAVPHRNNGQGYIYLAAAGGAFSESRRVPFGPPKASVRTAEAADFDQDGFTDLVTIDEDAGVTLYFGERAGGFSTGISLSGPKPIPYAVTIADLDKDRRPDIVVGHVEASSRVYFNTGPRTFSPVAFGDNKGAVYGFAIADFDYDGWPDIAAARSDAPNIVYFATPAKESR